MKIAVIGAGNMSEAILAGVIEQGVLSAEQIIVSDPLAERREHMQATYGVLATQHNDQAVATADVIMLAIKPQVSSRVGRSAEPTACVCVGGEHYGRYQRGLD